jgi:hypothetical protein
MKIFDKAADSVGEMLQLTVLLIILGGVIQITGTVFFGANLMPFIILVISAALLIKAYKSDMAEISWIKKKLKEMLR